MKVKVKKLHKDAVIPSYANDGDAGMDLTAISKSFDEHGNVVYGTGLAFEIPTGYVGLLFPRSNNSKKDLLLSNGVGLIDSGYRGEVMMKFKQGINVSKLINNSVRLSSISVGSEPMFENMEFTSYEIGDRIGQLVIIPYPTIEFIESDELSDSERGSGGYGSTGK